MVNTISDVNAILVDCLATSRKIGASSIFDWCFTFESFAKLYCDYHGNSFDYKTIFKKII